MPDIVNDDDLSALAAEYVLGTLDANERTRANVLLDVDHQFLSKVRIWERRLGELHLMVEPVEPETRIWQRIRGKLKNVAPGSAAPPPVPPPAPVSPANLKMPSGVPFPPPMEAKPVVPASAAGHRLVGLMQEVEKITADPKLAELKIDEARPAETTPFGAPTASSPPAPFGAPVPFGAPAASVPPEPNAADVAWASTPDPKPPEPEVPAPTATAAEIRPIDVLTAALEPRPTVAELAARLAPEPVEPVSLEPRPVDRIRREAANSAPPEPPRKKAKRLAIDRAARPASVGLWRGIAALMLLFTMALSGLIASWRYIPERLPAGLRPMAVLNLSDVTSSVPRKAGAIAVQFDE